MVVEGGNVLLMCKFRWRLAFKCFPVVVESTYSIIPPLFVFERMHARKIHAIGPSVEAGTSDFDRRLVCQNRARAQHRAT